MTLGQGLQAFWLSQIAPFRPQNPYGVLFVQNFLSQRLFDLLLFFNFVFQVVEADRHGHHKHNREDIE